MQKIVLMSILLAIIVIPLRHAGAADAQLGLRKTLVEFCWFNLLYVLAIAYVALRLP